MARIDPTEETWRRRREERVQRERDRKYRHRILRAAAKNPRPVSEFDLERVLGEVQSPDEATRARAVRNLCPCRVGWRNFEQGIDVVTRMQKDSSPEVRRQALHVFEDAFEMASEGLPTSPRTITNEMAARRREMRWSSDPFDEGALEQVGQDSLKRTRQQEREIKREQPRSVGKR
jgi:hypothetical protein